jgi:protease PrsW
VGGKNVKKRRLSWLWIFILGIILFVIANVTLMFTRNVLYFPTVMMIGAFLIPVTFVAFFYEQENRFDQHVHASSILPALLLCALLGGLIGTLAAGSLEYTTLSSKQPTTLAWIGPIEEFAKLIVPLALYVALRKRFRSELDGLLFGVASGMSFAALETMGYELITLVTTQGDLAALDQTIIVRGLLSPAGHAAWTGMITATLWRGRAQTGSGFTLSFVVVFAMAALLHSLWDYTSFFNSLSVIIPAYIAIGGVSLGLLFWRLGQARRSAVAATEVPGSEPG